MRTRKPIATVGYLTETYLSLKLNEALNNGKIQFWAFIKHKGDEDLKKDHLHVFVIPEGTIDTVSFNDNFIEIDPYNPLPLRLLHWNPSKFDDWYMYILHDPVYLEMKRLKRNYRYSKSDVWVSDMDEFDYMVSMIDYGYMCSLSDIINAAESQMSISQAIKEGIIPQGSINKYINIFRSIKYDSCPRDNNEQLQKKYQGGL